MEQKDYEMVREKSAKYHVKAAGERVMELWRQCTDSPLAFKRTLTGIVRKIEGDLTQENVENLAREAFETADRQWNNAEKAAYDATTAFYEAIARRENTIHAKTAELAQLEVEILGYRSELRKARNGLKYLAGTERDLERAEKKVKALRSELKGTRKDRRSLRAKLMMTEDASQANEASFQMARDETQSYRGELGELAYHTHEIEKQRVEAEAKLEEALARARPKLDKDALLRAMESYQSRARKVDTSRLREL